MTPVPTPALPLTVREVRPIGGALWAVTIVMADNTERTVIIPETLATLEAVRFSALALAVLSSHMRPMSPPRTAAHGRYARMR